MGKSPLSPVVEDPGPHPVLARWFRPLRPGRRLVGGILDLGGRRRLDLDGILSGLVTLGQLAALVGLDLPGLGLTGLVGVSAASGASSASAGGGRSVPRSPAERVAALAAASAPSKGGCPPRSWPARLSSPSATRSSLGASSTSDESGLGAGAAPDRPGQSDRRGQRHLPVPAPDPDAGLGQDGPYAPISRSRGGGGRRPPRAYGRRAETQIGGRLQWLDLHGNGSPGPDQPVGLGCAARLQGVHEGGRQDDDHVLSRSTASSSAANGSIPDPTAAPRGRSRSRALPDGWQSTPPSRILRGSSPRSPRTRCLRLAAPPPPRWLPRVARRAKGASSPVRTVPPTDRCIPAALAALMNKPTREGHPAGR